MKGWRKDGKKLYFVCCGVDVNGSCISCMGGAKGPGEAAHVENEGRSEGEAAAEEDQDAAKHRQILELQTRNTICGSMCIGQARHIA